MPFNCIFYCGSFDIYHSGLAGSHLFFVPVYIVKISTVPKKLLRIGPDPFFHSPAQATVHSPKLIFHVMKFRDQKSVLLSVNLLIGRTGITWNLTPVKRPFLSYLSIRILILQH